MVDIAQIQSFYPEHLRPFKRNLLREYLQYIILEIVFTSDFGGKLAFMGGTAIHIAHSNARFSEDLDFDNTGLSREDFKKLGNIILKKLKLQGYTAEIKSSFKAAYRLDIKISGVLYENKLSAYKDEKISIHLDAEPQGFDYTYDKVIINKFGIFTRINVVPVDILLAQKLFAILMRRRAVGRDFYDAMFLFGKTKPNFSYLKLKLGIRNLAELKNMLIEKSEKLDFKNLAKDVRQFLFIPEDARKVLLFNDYIGGMDAQNED